MRLGLGLAITQPVSQAAASGPEGVAFIGASAVTIGNDDLTIAYPAGSGAGDRLVAWMAWNFAGAEVVAAGGGR